MSASPPPPPPPEETPPPPATDQFYDTKLSIEAMQNEPYENGFTWRTVLGALFISLVMLPGLIFMGLMIGQDLGSAIEWVTIILFVEVARRAFLTLTKQELYVLKYTASQLTHIAGGLSLGGGIFAYLVWNRYLRNSDAFHTFALTDAVPDWFAPAGEAAWAPFWDKVWWPVIGVTVLSMLLSKLTQLSLGYLAFKVTADVEKLPFPLAPINAEGAIALAESNDDRRKTGYRQTCFSTGAMMGAGFGLLYVAVPALTSAIFGRPVMLLPIPFYDATTLLEGFLPGGTFGISLNLGLLFIGFVIPWRIAVGMFGSVILFQVILNPILQRFGYLPSWFPGKDAIETHVSNHLDIYLSVGIGTALAIAVVGLWGLAKAFWKHSRNQRLGSSSGSGSTMDPTAFWRQDRGRGDPPTWIAIGVWVLASLAYVFLANHLINGGLPADERFGLIWLVGFAFFWTPLNTYINARLSGIAGQNAGIPYVTEAAIFSSGHRGTAVWFAPLPVANYGSMADLLKETQLTRTNFRSLLKAELLVFPLLLVASFAFWSYVVSLGPVPSDNYPYVQKFWPQFAQLKALWASSMQEGQNLLMNAIKPEVIALALGVSVAGFAACATFGISVQYLYGALGAMTGYPHTVVPIFLGAMLGRFVLAKRFGREKWLNYAPILAVGFAAGMGLVGMCSIALNFLWTAVGTGF